MSHRRKHVTNSVLQDHAEAPGEHQHIVRALGSRGSNIVEVEHPDGRCTLCLMPAKFNKKLWVRRGGFLVVEESPEAELDSSSRVTATIVAVLYDEHVKALRGMPGVWPSEFNRPIADSAAPLTARADASDTGVAPTEEVRTATAAGRVEAAAAHAGGQGEGQEGSGDEDDEDEDDSDMLPPLLANTNRKVIYHEMSDSDEG